MMRTAKTTEPCPPSAPIRGAFETRVGGEQRFADGVQPPRPWTRRRSPALAYRVRDVAIVEQDRVSPKTRSATSNVCHAWGIADVDAAIEGRESDKPVKRALSRNESERVGDFTRDRSLSGGKTDRLWRSPAQAC